MTTTLMDIDNAIDNLTIYAQLGSAQHALLHSIIRIFNNQKERFPESLVIANTELQTKAGIKPGSFHRTRTALLEFKIDQSDSESWIIRYQENPGQAAGRYRINYTHLQCNNNITTAEQPTNNNITTTEQPTNNKPLSKNAKNDNDLREIRENRIDNNDVDDFSNEDLPSFSEDEIAIIALLNKKYATTWDGGMQTKFYPKLKEIASYPYNEIVEAVIATQNSCKDKPPKMLSYLLTVIKNSRKDARAEEDAKPPYHRKAEIPADFQPTEKTLKSKEIMRELSEQNVPFADRAVLYLAKMREVFGDDYLAGQ